MEFRHPFLLNQQVDFWSSTVMNEICIQPIISVCGTRNQYFVGGEGTDTYQLSFGVELNSSLVEASNRGLGSSNNAEGK